MPILQTTIKNQAMRIIAIFSSLLFFVVSLNPGETDEKDFQAFLSNFGIVSAPYTIDAKYLYHLTRRPVSKEISYQDLDFIPYKRPVYSRMGPDDYTYEKEIALSDKYRTIIVGGKRPFEENPHFYHLITYTPKGNVIDYKEVAWTYGKREMARCHIATNGEVTIEHCTNHLDKNGNIAKTDVDETDVFVISDAGKISRKEIKLQPIQLQQQEEQSARASLD
jgi:hypothetical protein